MSKVPFFAFVGLSTLTATGALGAPTWLFGTSRAKWSCDSAAVRDVGSKMRAAAIGAQLEVARPDQFGRPPASFVSAVQKVGADAGTIATEVFLTPARDTSMSGLSLHFGTKRIRFSSRNTTSRALYLSLNHKTYGHAAGRSHLSYPAAKTLLARVGSYYTYGLIVTHDRGAGTGGAYFNICALSNDGKSPKEAVSVSLDRGTKADPSRGISVTDRYTYFRMNLPDNAGLPDDYAIFIEPQSNLRVGDFWVRFVPYACTFWEGDPRGDLSYKSNPEAKIEWRDGQTYRCVPDRFPGVESY